MIRGMVARTTPLPWCEEEVNGPRTESEIALTQAAVNAIVPALAYIDELEACLAYLFKQGGTPASVEFSKMELDSQYKEVLDNFLSHVRADAERGAI